MKFKKSLLFKALLLFSLLSPQAMAAHLGGVAEAADLSPFWKWKTIETDHFRINFPENLTDVGQKVAGYYERAHELLSPVFRWEADTKVEVLLVDNTDLANGFTTPVFRIGMVLMVTPPEGFFSTAYYDDWLWLLIVHEYTHFLNMDTTREFYQVARYLLGDVLLPNSLWPSWMLEGLAVYMETRFTAAGRGRSPYFGMLMRTAHENGTLGTRSFATFNQIQGRNPYFPSGETPYFFGYSLMNQAAHQKTLNGTTYDGVDFMESGEDILGLMSFRSAKRVPFFISGNLENLVDKSWDQLWQEWIEETQATAKAQLAQIRKLPVTQVQPLTDPSFTELGFAFSPNGKWLAYTRDDSDHRMSLFLRDLSTQKERPIESKILGSRMQFTADSKTLILSRIHRVGNYSLFSDLCALDPVSGNEVWLTDGLRARDPALSPVKIGTVQHVAFTLTDQQTTGLAVGDLSSDAGGALKVVNVQRVFFPEKYGRVSSPVFSADGKRIFFSLHANKGASEQLVEISIDGKDRKLLVNDRAFNSSPTVGPDGSVVFVSDRDGVLNLYRLHSPTQVERLTNVITGAAFPGYDSKGKLFATAFSGQGWQVAEVQNAGNFPAISAEPLEPLPPFSAPLKPTPQENGAGSTHADYPVRDYSIFPTIWPRQWYFLPSLYAGSIYFNGIATGFDAVDRHRYFVNLGYDTLIKEPDWVGLYENRSFGPTFSLGAGESTTVSTRRGTDFGSTTLLTYERSKEFSFTASYPIKFTESVVTPGISGRVEQTRSYIPILGGEVLRSKWVPSEDAFVSFTNAQSTRLAIVAEEGRRTLLGVRRYENLRSEGVYKLLAKDREQIKLVDHVVLSPSVAATMVNAQSPGYRDADVNIEGRSPRLLASLPGSDFDQLGIRGYPQQIFYSKEAAVGALDLYFPIARLFSGWSTRPVFLESLSGFAFGEDSYVYPKGHLPSAGGGVRLDSTVFIHVPLILTFEFHKGFRSEYGGAGEWFATLGLGNLGI